MSTTSMSTRTNNNGAVQALPWIHSTFRDDDNQILYPKGLQWDIGGLSHMTFVVPPGKDTDDENNKKMLYWNLTQAYNRWRFAKDCKFVTVDDIVNVKTVGGTSNVYQVEWKEPTAVQTDMRHVHVRRYLEKYLNQEEAANKTTQVWINGYYICNLYSPKDLDTIFAALPEEHSDKKVCVRLSSPTETTQILRVERYFSGYLRRAQVMDHILDNLYALEDPKILDEQTLIGSATLPDWIMGGELTSRLWIRDLLPDENAILFLRPLRNDDTETSDRRFKLTDKPIEMAMVREELQRLRYLANLKHPLENRLEKDAPPKSNHELEMAAVRKTLKRNRKKRTFFGL